MNHGRVGYIVTAIGAIALLGTAIARADYREIDGTGNNAIEDQWGSTDEQLRRLAGPAYDDGLSEPRGGLVNSALPSAREVSNAIAAQSGLVPNTHHASNWLWQWGQFLDHDLDLSGGASPVEPFDIEVPANDPQFTHSINLNRSAHITDIHGVRQQTNTITAWIDGSGVYGSDATRAAWLRLNDGSGKLKTSTGMDGETLMPFNDANNPVQNASDNPMLSVDQFYVAGDIRANEQVGLTAAHTLFVREHNRIAMDLKARLDANETALVSKFNNSGLSEEDFLYESARKLVGAQIQKITYEEFLPLLMGSNSPNPAAFSYNDTLQPDISNEFSTAAFRVGHTMLSPQMKLVDINGNDVGALSLKDSFFNPTQITSQGVNEILLGLSEGRAQEIDHMIIDDVRNFLFAFAPGTGFDLVSLNIQRGRDHGLPSLNAVRDALGLGAHATFLDLTGGDATLAGLFASVYDDVDDVDLWIGGLGEAEFGEAMIGETFWTILDEQFSALMNADSFFYTNQSIHEHLLLLDPGFDSLKLSDLIEFNTGALSVRDNAFVIPTPSTLSLGVLGLIGLVHRRHRRTA